MYWRNLRKAASDRTEKMNPAIWLLGVVVGALVFAGAVTATRNYLRSDTHSKATAAIGGPFSLVDQHGRRVTERDYLGRPTLMFFGFTNCPDICPTTLLDLTERLKELGPDADRLNVAFVTVDPQRDTPEQLGLYLSSFDHRITGLSGSPRDIAAIMTEYRVYARKVPLKDGDYTMDHTAAVYMMNPKGQFVGLLNYQEPEATTREKIRKLLDDAARG